MYRFLATITIAILLFVGCSQEIDKIEYNNELKNNENNVDENPSGFSGSEIDNKDINTEVDKKPVESNYKYVIDTNKSIEENIDNILKNMSLNEKIGQLFIVDADSLNNGNTLTNITDNANDIIKTYNPSGVIFFKNNIETINQTYDLISNLQESSALPLFISVDEEGGLVSRIAKNPNMHATILPNSKVIGETNNPKNAYEIGTILAREISSLGFNMDFAPVADVNTNKDNEVIGVRAYGSDKDLVGDMVYNAVQGIQSENVSAVIKHFPGHGDTTNDTHTGSVVVNHNIDRLREVEFIPFIRGIEASVDGVMMAHIKVPNVTKDDIEASLSKEIVTDLLRKELGYNGLVITDALNMGAIANEYSAQEACVKAILAGVDILLMPIPFEESYVNLMKAVNEGVITEDRIDESVKRILTVKINRKLFEEHIKNPHEVLGNNNHKKIIEDINSK
ncbi:MAG: glycoside hydrolase family 3 protein [Vallitalea sp.]|jgi:beta-N-acetylhexosaminidase|nr:glycoside hydrolase family 3 protein [Vallitalea sp.]